MLTAIFRWPLLALLCAGLLSGCGGGGDSSTTTFSGPGLTGLVGPRVTLGSFVQKDNNALVEVKPPPVGFGQQQANLLYTDVTICEPVSTTNTPKCVTVSHIQLDTGSVGLRVLASKLAGLNLPKVGGNTAQTEQWECYPFVIGGLWGANAQADVTLGRQVASNLNIQLIRDDTTGPASTNDCNRAAGGKDLGGGSYQNDAILSDAAMLGSNGILGIGATMQDCYDLCRTGSYGPAPNGLGFVMYYNCSVGATSSSQCSSATSQDAQQTFNPVSALPLHNNGVVLALPAVSYPGASYVSGELIFGVNTATTSSTLAGNMLPGGTPVIALGTNTNSAAYLTVNTLFNGSYIPNSYLDTGSNGLFFSDNIALCPLSNWYCPFNSASKQAKISDGDTPGQHEVTVNFQVDNAEVMFSTSNLAFSGLAGAPPSSSGITFAWGLPFFFGKRTFLTTWNPALANHLPSYAWTLP
jgi:Protein of unknown function (DUF3443)